MKATLCLRGDGELKASERDLGVEGEYFQRSSQFILYQ